MGFASLRSLREIKGERMWENKTLILSVISVSLWQKISSNQCKSVSHK